MTLMTLMTIQSSEQARAARLRARRRSQAGFTLMEVLVALVVFAISAISVPLLMTRRIDAVSAMAASIVAVQRNPKAMLLWAALIAGLKTIRGQSGVGTAAGLEGLQRQAEQISRSVHRIAWELRPAALDAMGLEAATASWVERWSEWVGVPVEFHSTLGPIRLQPEVETQIYRIVTEALSNVLKHARASRTGVSLEHHRGMIVACVEDDGQGFDPESAADRGGLGLLGMRERATLLGGTLHVESAPGRGTTVLIRVPCPTFSGGNS